MSSKVNIPEKPDLNCANFGLIGNWRHRAGGLIPNGVGAPLPRRSDHREICIALTGIHQVVVACFLISLKIISFPTASLSFPLRVIPERDTWDVILSRWRPSARLSVSAAALF